MYGEAWRCGELQGHTWRCGEGDAGRSTHLEDIVGAPAVDNPHEVDVLGEVDALLGGDGGRRLSSRETTTLVS